MLASSIPTKIPVPFASSASGSFVRPIPIPSQISTDPGAASFTDGFVPLNGTPIAAGGIPPDERDMNGILLAITQWNQWANAGGPIPYDAAFQTAVGGYPARAIIQSAVVPGKQWLSLVDNNTTNPDTVASSGWATPFGMLPSGTPVASFSSTVPPGFIASNGLSIGNASSGASTSSGTMLFLFCAVWLEFPNSQCPLLNSSGTPVARGANPFADFAANCRITLPQMQGVTFVGCDTMGGVGTGFLSSVPIVSGGTTIPGSVLGENLHTLTAGQIPGITSTGSALAVTVFSTVTDVIQGGVGSSTTGGGSIGIEVLSGGASSGITSTGQTALQSVSSSNTQGQSHNTVQRSFTVFWNLAI